MSREVATEVSNANEFLAVDDCMPMYFDPKSIWSKKDIEVVVATALNESLELNGFIDWDCVVFGFEQVSGRANVEFIPNGGLESADVFRFTLDRSNEFWAVVRSFGFGASNGLFTAIVNRAPDGRVFIVKRGGQLEWLK